MKKILFLVTQSEFGGAQRYIFEMSQLFDKNKYEVKVAAGSGDGELFKKLADVIIPSIQLKEMKRAPSPLQLFKAIKEIRVLIKEEHPDILFLCSTTAGFLGALASIFTNPKIVYRIGGWAFNDPRLFWQNWIIILAEKATSSLKDIVIVNSEFDWRIAVKKRVVSAEKIVKIYNGLDPDKLNFLSKEESKNVLGLSDGYFIGTVANFYKTKGLEVLIKSAREVVKSNSKAKFIIIGDGKLRPQLEKKISKYNLENNVILKGRIPSAYKYLKAFDLFVLPSLKEGFPWIILEAMAAELPIIATKVGAMPEIITDKEDGVIVNPGNHKELAESIKEVIENQTKASIMGSKARTKLINKFSLEKMAKKTEETISNI
jgi:glycosyltransferase involved in cell wall biosynthesis